MQLHITGKGQEKNTSEWNFPDSCDWDKSSVKSKKVLSPQIGIVQKRFGTYIILIKGKAYNPCILPSILLGKKVVAGGIIYKKNKQIDGIPIKLTYLTEL